MKQAAKEAVTQNMEKFEQMKAIARAYITKGECSVQEVVYHIMPSEVKKTCPGVLFANSNFPENRYKMFQTHKELSELPEDSTYIFKCKMLDRHIGRPDSIFQGGKYAEIDKLCHAEVLCSPMTGNSLTVALLNMKLGKHALDIAADNSLLNSDVICLTETQLLPNEDMSYVECELNQFILVYNSSSFKFESLDFSVRKVNSVFHYDYL